MMVPQEPSALCNKIMLFVVFGFRNHMMVPQEPFLFEYSSTNLNTSGMLCLRNHIMVPQEPSVFEDSSTNLNTFACHPVRLL